MPWSVVHLGVRDVLLTVAREIYEDVRATVATLERQYSWLSLGEQGKRIRQIVNREETHGFLAALRMWHTYLEEHLVVPFVATVIQYQRGPVKQGDQVRVTGVSLLDETSGTIVRVRQKRRVSHLSLRDLRAINALDEGTQLVEDYAVWFARHPLIYIRFSP